MYKSFVLYHPLVLVILLNNKLIITDMINVLDFTSLYGLEMNEHVAIRLTEVKLLIMIVQPPKVSNKKLI